VKITPAWRVCILGIILCTALTGCARTFDDRGGPHFMASLMIAGVAYLLAIRELLGERSTPRKFPWRMVAFGLLLSAFWHVEFLQLAPGPDDDIHRYVWDGRVQRLGFNPYVVVPNDPAFENFHTAETRTLNHPDLPSPYPPGAQLFFRAVTTFRESVFAMKAAFVVCDLLIVLLLLALLRRHHLGSQMVLAFAWNPLLAIEVAGSGHIDIVGALFLLISFVALTRRWRTVSVLALGLAIAVKFLPIVLLPLYWKRIRIRDAALAAITVGVLYLPFLVNGHIPIGSLGTYVQSFRFNDPLFLVLERVIDPKILAGFVVLVGFLVAIWMRRKSEDLTAGSFAWPMAVSLLCAPVVYPWYLLWLIPFILSVSTLPIAIWTISIIPTYYVWHLRILGRPWILPNWIMLLEYGSIALSAVVVTKHNLARRVSPQG